MITLFCRLDVFQIARNLSFVSYFNDTVLNWHIAQTNCTDTLHRHDALTHCTGTLHRHNAQAQYTGTMLRCNAQAPCTGTMHRHNALAAHRWHCCVFCADNAPAARQMIVVARSSHGDLLNQRFCAHRLIELLITEINFHLYYLFLNLWTRCVETCLQSVLEESVRQEKRR